jgi:branched-chain amino acid aminotransferase
LNHNTRIWKFISEETKYHLEFKGEAVNLDEASQSLSEGVYTTFRTYEHDKVLRLEDHFERIEKSGTLQGRQMVLPRYVLRGGLREIIGLFPQLDVKIRIHCAFESGYVVIYLMAEPFTPIPEILYKNGAAVKTISLQRDNPRSKATNFIMQTKEIRKTKPGGINEYFMLDKNANLLEGMTSNIFVLRENAVWTAAQGILPGITRQVVLEVIAASGMKIEYSGFPLDEIVHAEEVFITSASRGVLPVVQIDEHLIGSGMPGELTQKIKTDYEKWLQSELRSV